MDSEPSGRAIARSRWITCSRCHSFFLTDTPCATPASLDERSTESGGAVGGAGMVNFDHGLSRAFNLYTTNFRPLVVVSLAFCAVSGGVAILQQIPILGILIWVVASFTITPVITAGFTRAVLRTHDGGQAKVDDLFVDLRHLGELARLVVVRQLIWLMALMPSLLIVAAGLVPYFVALAKDPKTTPERWQIAVCSLGALVLLVTAMVVAAGFLFSYVAFVDRRAGYWDAVKISWTLARNKPAATFGILLVGWLALFLGVLVCLVGVVFTLPFYHALLVAAYRSAMPAPAAADAPPGNLPTTTHG